MADPIRIYVDTNVYFDLLAKETKLDKETNEPRWKIAKKLFDAVNDDRVVLGASALIEAEVGCLGKVRNGDAEVLAQVREWFRAPATEWTDIDRFLARDATRLSKEWHDRREAKNGKLGGADATHLAAAIRLKCDYLMTQDEGFPIGHTVEGVKVMRPAVVWVEHLMDVADEQPELKPSLKVVPN